MEMTDHFDDIRVVHLGKDTEFSIFVSAVLLYLFNGVFLVVLFMDSLSVCLFTR
jgi:hypothetical protein